MKLYKPRALKWDFTVLVCNVPKQIYYYKLTYLAIIPRLHGGYELLDSRQAAEH